MTAMDVANSAYIMQGWGGRDSAAKADALIRDVIGWFYSNTGGLPGPSGMWHCTKIDLSLRLARGHL